MYKFKKKNQDEQSEFANEVCKLLVHNSGNNIDIAITKLESIFNHFENHVDNIYKLIEDEIPLFALYRLKKYGADNFGFTEKEYNKNIEICKKSCKDFYIDKIKDKRPKPPIKPEAPKGLKYREDRIVKIDPPKGYKQ